MSSRFERLCNTPRRFYPLLPKSWKLSDKIPSAAGCTSKFLSCVEVFFQFCLVWLPTGVSLSQQLSHARSRWWPDNELPEHLESLGFTSSSHFLGNLLGSWTNFDSQHALGAPFWRIPTTSHHQIPPLQRHIPAQVTFIYIYHFDSWVSFMATPEKIGTKWDKPSSFDTGKMFDLQGQLTNAVASINSPSVTPISSSTSAMESEKSTHEPEAG